MAKKKRRRRKASWPNRLINAALLALALSPVLRRIPLLLGNPRQGVNDLMNIYTAGLASGRFNPSWAAEAYGPPAVSFILFELKKAAMKKFRF